MRRRRGDSTAWECTHSRLLTSRRIDDALDSGVCAQPSVLPGGGASIPIEIGLGVLDCVVVPVLQPIQIVRRRGDVQDVFTGLGTTTGECGLRMLTLIDDARERALLGVDLNRIRALSGRGPFADWSLLGLPFLAKALTELAGCVLIVLCLCASAIGEWVVGLQCAERLVVRVEFVIGKGAACRLVDDSDRLIGRIGVTSDALVAFGIGEVACELAVTIMGVGDLHRIGATVRTAFECVLDLLGGDRSGRAGHRPSPPMAVALWKGRSVGCIYAHTSVVGVWVVASMP